MHSSGPGSFRNSADYGRGVVELSDAESLIADPTGVTDRLRELMRSSTYRPPMLPQAALQLMQLTKRADVSFSQVREVLDHEPLLAGQVLRVAQTAAYSRGAAIQSLDDAIARLGLRTLGDLFLQESLRARVFRAKGYEEPMAALMKHSALTAIAARLVCRRTSLSAEYAFLCGLLHDVGVAAGLLAMADQPPARRPDFAFVASAIAEVHVEAGDVLLKAWQIPVDVQFVVRHHHIYRVGGRPHPLAAAICVADWLSHNAGAEALDAVDEAMAVQAARDLSLDAAAVTSLRESVRAALAEQ